MNQTVVSVRTVLHSIFRRSTEPAPIQSMLGPFGHAIEDLWTVLDRDPSKHRLREAVLHAPWQGIAMYRLAHSLHRHDFDTAALALTYVARIVAGMEISPGAQIGRRFFVDHGFGVVIGEDSVVGDDVTLYHGVTLGSRGHWQDGASAGLRRHPVVGSRVKIGAKASVLGAVTVGDDCIIRAHQIVLHDVDALDFRSAERSEVVHTTSEPRDSGKSTPHP